MKRPIPPPRNAALARRKELPPHYAERVYAGVLGKLIGVYLGRPIEGWTHERISRELGEIDGYVNSRMAAAKYETTLVVADDDISGTFIFPRALPDSGFPRRLTAEQIGNAWLNYIVEERTVLWWGGIGTATEHTAYWRLRNGIAAPESGSATLNGSTLAEQIGGQIFIDGWALMSPAEPEQAAWLAGQAARVSHDGTAVEAAMLLAAMESQAFVEADVERLLDAGLRFVPPGSVLRRMIGDIREWHAAEPDWRVARRRIEHRYGYRRYGGACHVVPNHALIVLALLYGGGDFRRSLGIVCGSGWDTDCNAGNLGCLLGIRGGLAAIDHGGDWRGPIADRLFLPAADGGAVTDAVIEARSLIRAGYALAGRPAPLPPKHGARFAFEFPGSVQGFAPESAEPGLTLCNVPGHSGEGPRRLAIHLAGMAAGTAARVGTPTFFGPDDLAVPGYRLMGSPTLHSGQIVRMRLEADPANRAPLVVHPWCACFGAQDRIEHLRGPDSAVAPGALTVIVWRVPETGGRPISRVGIGIEPGGAADQASLHLDWLDWDGAPDTVLRRPEQPGHMWRHAWVDAADQFTSRWEAFRISHGRGLGLLIQGGRGWGDYEVSAKITPHLAKSWGLAARVGGLRHHLAIVFDDSRGGSGTRGDRVSIRRTKDGATVLAEAAFSWHAGRTYAVVLAVRDERIGGAVNGASLFDVRAADSALDCGGIALLCEEGSLSTEAIAVSPLGGAARGHGAENGP